MAQKRGEVYDATLEHKAYPKLVKLLEDQGLEKRHWIGMLAQAGPFATFEATGRGKPLAHLGDSTSKMGRAQDANEADKWMEAWLVGSNQWGVPNPPLHFSCIRD